MRRLRKNGFLIWKRIKIQYCRMLNKSKKSRDGSLHFTCLLGIASCYSIFKLQDLWSHKFCYTLKFWSLSHISFLDLTRNVLLNIWITVLNNHLLMPVSEALTTHRLHNNQQFQRVHEYVHAWISVRFFSYYAQRLGL